MLCYAHGLRGARRPGAHCCAPVREQLREHRPLRVARAVEPTHARARLAERRPLSYHRGVCCILGLTV